LCGVHPGFQFATITALPNFTLDGPSNVTYNLYAPSLEKIMLRSVPCAYHVRAAFRLWFRCSVSVQVNPKYGGFKSTRREEMLKKMDQTKRRRNAFLDDQDYVISRS
jgi:hypothetical protein